MILETIFGISHMIAYQLRFPTVPNTHYAIKSYLIQLINTFFLAHII